MYLGVTEVNELATIMKLQLLTILILVIPTFAFSQSYGFKHIEFEKESDSTTLYYDILKIKDTSTCVVLISKGGLWTYGTYIDYFVFKPNGKIRNVEKFISSNRKMSKNYSKTHTVKNLCKDSLLFVMNTSTFHFNQDSLIAMPTPIETTTGTIYINTRDGLSYTLTIMKGNKISRFSTRSPESIISAKSTGYFEKQKFLDLINSLEKIKNYDQH